MEQEFDKMLEGLAFFKEPIIKKPNLNDGSPTNPLFDKKDRLITVQITNEGKYFKVSDLHEKNIMALALMKIGPQIEL